MKWRSFFQFKIDPEFWLHMQASKVRHGSFCGFHDFDHFPMISKYKVAKIVELFVSVLVITDILVLFTSC